MSGWLWTWILAIGIPGGALIARLLFLGWRDTHPGSIPGDTDTRTLPATGAWFKRIGTETGADDIPVRRLRLLDRARQRATRIRRGIWS